MSNPNWVWFPELLLCLPLVVLPIVERIGEAMVCARCGRKITGGQPCDYHERGCTGEPCRCDTTQAVHRRCCLQPGCGSVPRDHANPRAV